MEVECEPTMSSPSSSSSSCTTTTTCSSSSLSTSTSSSSEVCKDTTIVSTNKGSNGGSGLKRQRDEKHPAYHGVRMRNWGRWVSEIREPKKKSRIWLGTYPTAEMAARAHDVAELTIKGQAAARLNFPELAHELPRPASATPKDIQVAAAKAAAADFRKDIQQISNSSAPATSSSSDDDDDNDDDKLFDLPDLFLGFEDVSCCYSSLWVSPVSDCGSGDGGFRLEDPFLLEYS